MVRGLLWILLLVSFPLQLSASDLLVVPLKIDLGDIRWGESREFSIKVINNGSRPYRIKRIVTYCSFLYVDRGVVGKPIAPGKEIEIKGKYRARVLGYFGKVIEIYTDHPSLKKFVVEITGKVFYPKKLPHLEIAPKKIKLGLLFPGEKKQFKIKISNKGNENLVVKYGGINLPPDVSSENVVNIPPGKSIEIGFEFTGEREGNFREVLWFSSNDPLSPRIPVVIEGRVVPYIDKPMKGAGLGKLAPLFLFLTGLTVIIFALIRYA